MHGQEHTTITLTKSHQLALTALVNSVSPRRFVGADHGIRRLNATEAAALSEIVAALSQVASGAAVTLQPLAEYVSLTEVRRALRVSRASLYRWLAQRNIAPKRGGRQSYLSRDEFDSLRQWRISLNYPEPQ